MEICRLCWSCSSICECGDEAIFEEAGHCENCGSLGSMDEDLNQDGYCYEPDCQEAHEEYRDAAVGFILANLPETKR
jgi:hypothetical protein